MILTEKLSKFEKESNATRRAVLLQVKKLLKDKSVVVNFSIENMIGRSDEYHKMFYTGNHKVTLDWWARVE